MKNLAFLPSLRSVGMAIFVNYYDIFQECASGKLTKQKAMEQFSDATEKPQGGVAWCVNSAIKIFDMGAQYRALERCLSSRRVKDITPDARKKAEKVLRNR